MRGFLIGGTASGVGKTTVTLAVIAAMRRRGLVVQPFKGGPDFLDTGHHTRVAGRAARNVDTWMLSVEANREVVRGASVGADAVVVEGMMGLFDGKDGVTESGSSAEIAKLLGLPVVLVIDAGKSARSVAAVVLGFELFDPALVLAGVVLNRVASERHYAMLVAAIGSACRTPVLGWLPREPRIAIPERHLGLQTAGELSEGDVAVQTDLLAAVAETHLDMEAFLALECGIEAHVPDGVRGDARADSIRIGVARDSAFSFYYEDNLDLLREQGAEIVSFSPMLDGALPRNLDAIYLGGGYPELHAHALSGNVTMLADMREFVASGRPVYAECGGMIYLSQRLTTIDGEEHAMAGVLPCSFEMTAKLVQFGYVSVELMEDCLLGERGTTVRGHSFHYSRMTEPSTMSTSYRVSYSLSGRVEDEGYCVGHVVASYIHLHFRAAPLLARHFVEAARAARTRELVHA